MWMDQGDFRPGQAAATQHHVAALCLEAKANQAGNRELARAAGLRIWEKPASAMLVVTREVRTRGHREVP